MIDNIISNAYTSNHVNSKRSNHDFERFSAKKRLHALPTRKKTARNRDSYIQVGKWESDSSRRKSATPARIA